MADKDVKINITTKGDTSGAEKIDKAIDRIQTTAKKVGAGSVNEFAALTDKAKVAEFAFYDLDAAMGKTQSATQTYTAGVTQAGKATGDSSRALLMFSQGFEDAQYGIRGVLNNIPGLVIALGGTAGIAGAVSIAAVSFSVLYDWLGKTEEKATDVEDRIQKVAAAIGEAEVKKFNEVGDAILYMAEEAESLRKKWVETQSAESASAISALDNAAKVESAQKRIAEQLGLQVNHFNEIEAVSKRESERLALEANQALEVEQRKVEARQLAVDDAATKLGAAKAQQAAGAAELVDLRAKLQALRDERDELERISKLRKETDDPGLQLLGAVFPKIIPRTDEAKAASETLESAPFQQMLATQQARVDELEKAMYELTDPGGTLTSLENNLNQAKTNLQDTTSAVEIKARDIARTLELDTITNKLDEVEAKGKARADEIKEVIGKFTTNNERGLAASRSMAQLASDGQIQVNEQAQYAQNLQVLMGLLQSGQATYNGQVAQLITLQQKNQIETAQNSQRLRDLEANVRQINREATQ